MGPEALHLLDDMLAAAWNTNRAGVTERPPQYRTPLSLRVLPPDLRPLKVSLVCLQPFAQRYCIKRATQ